MSSERGLAWKSCCMGLAEEDGEGEDGEGEMLVIVVVERVGACV